MENHPIPQDITGFQFRLVGNMTVKQFLYLAAGTIISWLFFFVLPLPALIRWPIAIISIGFGGAIAFIPIDGRPMDQMFINLIKAIIAPTQYVYDKTGGILPTLPIQNAQRVTTPRPNENQQTAPAQSNQDLKNTINNPIPQQAPAQTSSNIPSESSQPSTNPASQVIQTASVAQPTAVASTPSSLGWSIENEDKDDKRTRDQSNQQIRNEVKLENEISDLKNELADAKAEDKAIPTSPDQTEMLQKTEQLNKILEQTLAQKAELEKELALLKSKPEDQPKPQTYTPTTATVLPQTQNVKQVPKGLEKTTGVIAASQDPNVVIGIVKDPRGNPLQNILVEVKDTEDNPVRAFKTNALGKFASATSLSNGKYVITFEDTRGQNKFDTVQIETTGGILPPLEVFSVDQREELRRELFN